MVPDRRLSNPIVRRLALAAATLLAAASFAAVALAGGTPTVKGLANATLGHTIVVNPSGRTLYALSPETTHHLLCKGRECLAVWPPLTVPSRTTKLKAGPGVQGKLGVFRRSNGHWQVTLRGKPLYRFSEEHHSGETAGEGLETFGGTWHSVAASASVAPAPTMPATPTTPTSTPPYGY
jgi:predicted lipoprotein with Yx(FWY)xxD motif